MIAALLVVIAFARDGSLRASRSDIMEAVRREIAPDKPGAKGAPAAPVKPGKPGAPESKAEDPVNLMNASMPPGFNNNTGPPPPVYPTEECTPLGFPGEYEVTETGGNGTHGSTRNITCSAGNLPTRGLVANTTCDNGTWTDVRFENPVVYKPIDINCQSEEQVRLLKAVMYYLDYTNGTRIETERRSFVWKDSGASQRMDTLKQLQAHSVTVINDTTMDIWPSAEDLQKLVTELINYNMEPRGEQFTQKTCENFANHTLYKFPAPDASGSAATFANSNIPPVLPNGLNGEWDKSVEWTCQHTIQNTGIGWDYMNAKPVMFYREGCYCQSKMMLGCPMKWPLYQHFGFSAMEDKGVEGSDISALCWYWSDPTHPEWGYLANATAGTTHDMDPRITTPATLPGGVANVESAPVNSTEMFKAMAA